MKQQQLVLNERPNGLPNADTFAFKEINVENPGHEQLLLKTLYISVDPYMRGRMADGPSYIEPFQIGEPLSGGVVAQVVTSKSEQFQQGDIVTGMLNFQEYHVVEANQVRKVNTFGLRPSVALGPLGMPGLTAYFGMMHIGEPKQGETVVISGAAGAVGQVAGQLAKRAGAHVIGIVGSKEKANYITKTLGYDHAIEYKHGDVPRQLKEACPNGIDIYFENVGGEISDAVWPLLNTFARVPVCGAISSYNLEAGEYDIGIRVQTYLIKARAKMQGFLVGDYADHFKEAYEELGEAIASGELKYEETIREGFESIPDAFIGLFTGENIGKQLVKVAEQE
ncbi:putative NADP-dependent oxidoreductase YfmJ [Virgibacillus pantothenticus]|uniref:Alcohol dehydrogenase n=1 Tax=Virgibacillus pantothenticus TaxID=1473 RepID=A0A0L0QVA0_VIRPA|nr:MULTISPECIES: NADP-dependent oxidoreductase [Virgibacillus]API92450.1 NADP-dependent oxidoreductase [Virgibacillus sp. 6R]KNE22600.1 alcohol dehydrogenase [Virgibacillus pantothenticus]MBS7427299.1 NADP-dependent oxidoreductase [Virgibacillus sp. 19R1-5]MED3737018.1 NADP-dependent oxidoreductase [Virgibacillus pantothenticus]QTY16646.1 NADP-dependent oxidoreductase [Virgibacillus pantothenticus]